jgi:hypothetical protein
MARGGERVALGCDDVHLAAELRDDEAQAVRLT